jgi:hypothetical protein
VPKKISCWILPIILTYTSLSSRYRTLYFIVLQKSWLLLGMLMTLFSCSSAYLSVGISTRPFIAHLHIRCTFLEPAVCSFPPVHFSVAAYSSLVCCFDAFTLFGGGFGCALWKSAYDGEVYERQGSYRRSGVFVPVFLLLARERGRKLESL